MAQQTINVGTAPNDGTGTPLRTAFQYTNSNFSELYTAVGPSGNNIVVPGNATITGDLTVDTSTLKVDSANNRVGVVQATPLYPLHLVGEFGLQEDNPAGTGTKLRFIGDATKYNFRLGKQLTANNTFEITPSTAVGGGTFSNPVYTVSYDGIHTFLDGAGGTRMTLNANGLGIGVTPTNKLEVVAPAGDNIVSTFRSGDATAANNAGGGFRSISSATAASRVAQVWLDADGANFSGGDYFYIQKNGNSGTVEFNQSSNAAMTFLTNSTERMRIDSSGNVGIGVAPSAWTSAFGSVLQFKSAGSSAGGSLTGSSADNFRMFSNTYYDGAYKYIAAGFATQYEQSAGSHVWYLSGTTAGAINGAITFSTALSLDKTGSLVLGSAAVATTATDGFLYIPSCAGAPTGVPTTKTGRVPMVVDSTNNRFYVYVGGTWKYTTLA